MPKGILITFEGPEGGGKSTQIKRLLGYLARKRRSTGVLFREPGGTKIGEAIREIILNRKHGNMFPETELLLYLAARAQLVREKILPALKRGKVVVLDRFEDSTLAYQGFGRKMSVQEIEKLSRTWVRGKLEPNLVIVLDIDPKAGMRRGGRQDRMENQALAFHRRVRSGFLTLARKNRKKYLVVDARKSKDEVFREIVKGVERVL